MIDVVLPQWFIEIKQIQEQIERELDEMGRARERDATPPLCDIDI